MPVSGRLVDDVLGRGGAVLITADHGNAELMTDPVSHQPYTAHTLNPVPFLLVSSRDRGKTLRQGAALKDIAPTMLALLQLPVPDEMEGESLLV